MLFLAASPMILVVMLVYILIFCKLWNIVSFFHWFPVLCLFFSIGHEDCIEVFVLRAGFLFRILGFYNGHPLLGDKVVAALLIFALILLYVLKVLGLVRFPADVNIVVLLMCLVDKRPFLVRRYLFVKHVYSQTCMYVWKTSNSSIHLFDCLFCFLLIN